MKIYCIKRVLLIVVLIVTYNPPAYSFGQLCFPQDQKVPALCVCFSNNSGEIYFRDKPPRVILGSGSEMYSYWVSIEGSMAFCENFCEPHQSTIVGDFEIFAVGSCNEANQNLIKRKGAEFSHYCGVRVTPHPHRLRPGSCRGN